MYPEFPKFFNSPRIPETSLNIRCYYTTRDYLAWPEMNKFFEHRPKYLAKKPADNTPDGYNAQANNAAPPPAPVQQAVDENDPNAFFCTCRDCQLYFKRGDPIECVNPYKVLAAHHPKWNYMGLVPDKRSGGTRRPAEEPAPQNELVKRRKR